MDGVRFDALARALGSVVDRRATARTLAGGALGVLGLAAGHGAEAKKKKKKCKKGTKKCGKKCCPKGQACRNKKCVALPPAEECNFSKSATQWTLQADCSITRTIVIPDGVTVDGNGKKISVPAPPTSFAAIVGTGFKVQDLTVEGPGCTTNGAMWVFFLTGNDSGEFENVTIRNFSCAGHAIFCGGGNAVDVSDCTFDEVESGVTAVDGCESTVTGCTFAGVPFALSAEGAGSTLVATNNTLVGLGPDSQSGRGISYTQAASGEVSGNSISNYYLSGAGEACGIFIDASATGVTLGTNTFPDPPGNEQDVCDNRP